MLSCLATQQSGRPLVHGRRVRRLVAEIAPDVIHYHNILLVGPSFKATAWGGIGLALAVTLLADPICRLVYGEAFLDAGATLSVLVWTIPLTLFSGHSRWALVARGEQRFVALAQLAGAVVTLSVCGWGTLRWGALGGAAGMVSSAAVVWFVAHACARRTVRHIPFLGAVARPALAALLVGVVILQLDGADWLIASGGVLGFAALGPILDWRLVATCGVWLVPGMVAPTRRSPVTPSRGRDETGLAAPADDGERGAPPGVQWRGSAFDRTAAAAARRPRAARSR